MTKLFRFLGSVYFTCTLLATVALFVIIGTLIESKTGSHAYAAAFTYSNPVFTLLLWMFFVNILVATLRRYPFKRGHIPFLITHLGLLMLLFGVIVKHHFGMQGTMALYEGTERQTVALENSRELMFKAKDKKPVDNSDFQVVAFSPHGEEVMETWFKGDLAVINGIKPFPIATRKSYLKMPGSHMPVWELYTLRNQKIEPLYFEGMFLRLTDRRTDEIVTEQLLEKKLSFPKGKAEVAFTEETLIFHITYQGLKEVIELPIQGEKALLSSSELPLAIDLIRKPALIFLQTTPPDVTLYAIDAHGQLYKEHFSKETITSFFSYDEGFLGYHIETKIPFSPTPFGREERERGEQLPDFLKLECPLTFYHAPKHPQKKLEENVPGITLLYQKTPLSLTFRGSKIPTPDGKYLVSYGPKMVKIPHRIRLHDARQICYANTRQPFSYECDLQVDGEEVTLSMNRVHETSKGYRLYLANIAPGEETALQQVQLVINHDPAKYYLTYPGALIMTLGIGLLFSARARKGPRR